MGGFKGQYWSWYKLHSLSQLLRIPSKCLWWSDIFTLINGCDNFRKYFRAIIQKLGTYSDLTTSLRSVEVRVVPCHKEPTPNFSDSPDRPRPCWSLHISYMSISTSALQAFHREASIEFNLPVSHAFKMSTSRIVELAQLIASQTTLIDMHISDNGLSHPSLTLNGPADGITKLSPEITKAKNEVIEAIIELRQLLEGPLKLLLPEANFPPLAAVHHFHVTSYVPLNSTICFEELAAICGLLEYDLKRTVRYASVHHRAFCEPVKGGT